MSTFHKYLKGDITGAEARLELLISKINDKSKQRLDLEYLVNSIDVYQRRILQEDIIDLLKDIEPMIRGNSYIKEALEDENVDIAAATLSLIKKFNTTQNLGVLAGLVVLSIATRMKPSVGNRLISQAKTLAFRGNK